MEAWGLGMFMISASLMTILFQHPDCILAYHIPSGLMRRCLIGITMGATAVGIISSPWGRKSGAHINPSVTITMLMLRKISLRDAIFYIIFQTAGGIAGVCLISIVLPSYMNDSSVSYVVTIPGKAGITGAIIGEAIISFIMMFITLITSNNKKIEHLTVYIIGLLIISFVTIESPYSGFSMNPARTIASALPSHIWTAWPVYMIVPPLGMLIAAIAYTLSFNRGEFSSMKHYFAVANTK
jgi:aquaporin Z